MTESHNHVGVTPFSLALQYRHWETARVVLAISVAQYKLKDAKPPKFRLKKVALGGLHLLPLLTRSQL